MPRSPWRWEAELAVWQVPTGPPAPLPASGSAEESELNFARGTWREGWAERLAAVAREQKGKVHRCLVGTWSSLLGKEAGHLPCLERDGEFPPFPDGGKHPPIQERRRVAFQNWEGESPCRASTVAGRDSGSQDWAASRVGSEEVKTWRREVALGRG